MLLLPCHGCLATSGRRSGRNNPDPAPCFHPIRDGLFRTVPVRREFILRSNGPSVRQPSHQIIKRLREFVARGESDRQSEDLSRLISEASALALVGAKETGVQVTFDLPRQTVWVLVDRIQIQQVILNLIRNAIEAMENAASRELRVAARPDAQGVEITVTDTGTGIDPDIAPRLFQPFVTSKPTGMGVGLSICRSIVEAHGGRLWPQANPAGGTIFHLTLPGAEPGAIAGEDADV